MQPSVLHLRASKALSHGDPIGAMNLVAGELTPHARAIRGIALAQLQDLDEASVELRAAAEDFQDEPLFRARALAALAEISAARRELSSAMEELSEVADQLESMGDSRNACWTRLVRVRALLLIGKTEAAQAELSRAESTKPTDGVLLGAFALARAATSARVLSAEDARTPLAEALRSLGREENPLLAAELEAHGQALELPLAYLRHHDERVEVSLATLAQVFRGHGELAHAGLQSAHCDSWFVIDSIAARVFLGGGEAVGLASREVLFDLCRELGRHWPEAVSTDDLILHVFDGVTGEESYRNRCRVELGRLRKLLPVGVAVEALGNAWRLVVPTGCAVIAVELIRRDSALSVLLADGHAWAARDLAIAIGASQRTVQRSLSDLAEDGEVLAVGRARNQRWIRAEADCSPLRIATQMYLASLLAPRDSDSVPHPNGDSQ